METKIIKKETDTPKIETTTSDSVESFISQAIASKVPVETLEKLLSLREKVKAEQAKSAFIQALARFQNDCPVITKTKQVLNKDGRTVRYTYAPIDSIVAQIKKPMSDNELSYTWNVKNESGFITAVATITHIDGYSESSEFKVPIDTNEYMTSPQRYASALTFAKRYSLCNALGLSTGDEDTDATDVGKETDAKSSKAKIMFLLRRLGHESKTKEEVASSVKKLAGLELKEKNYDEIVNRLEIKSQEVQEYENTKVQQ